MLAPINAKQLLLSILKRNGCGAEIGVHEGGFSASLLNALSPKRLWLVDPWQYFEQESHAKSMYGGANSSQSEMDARYARVTQRFAPEIEAGVVQIVREKSVKAAASVADNSLDFVYVDGDHTRDGVEGDINAWWPKLVPGGIMAFDDYTLTGWWKDGVVAAVHAALAARRCRIVLAMDSQIAIRKL